MDPVLKTQLTAEVFDSTFLGAPKDGELRKQALGVGYTVGEYLQELLSLDQSMPAFTAREMIAIILVMQKTRKATEVQILDWARSFPYICRTMVHGTPLQQEHAAQLLKNVTMLLEDANWKFDVEFPSEGYAELRAEPSLQAQKSNPEMWLAWRAKAGLGIAEEERDPEGELRYNYDFGQKYFDWWKEFDREYERRHNGRDKSEPVYVLPPGAENLILGHLYHEEPSTSVTATSQKSRRDYLRELPTELRAKIARYVLVVPGKLNVIATISDDGTESRCFMDQLRSTTYKFSPWVKTPRPMTDCYWSLEGTSTLLALFSVNKDFHRISKPIFYGENYFEVLDNQMNHIKRTLGLWQYGVHNIQRFLELLSWSRARDCTLRYGIRPLMFIRKINIDMDLLDQGVWHFDRISNALISIPHLTKLVININMSHLDKIDSGTKNVHLHPEFWPGLHKLPWAASTIVSNDTKSTLKLKVYIPENRKVEKWLQGLLDAPDHDLNKLGLVTYSDWATRECPSEMIVQGLQKADRRYMQAWHKANWIEKEAEQIKEDKKQALGSCDDSDDSTDDSEEDGDIGGPVGDSDDLEDEND